MAQLWRRLLYFLLCLLITNFVSQVRAANTTQNFHYFCDDNTTGNGTYTANSAYHANLNTLLSTLISNTEIDYGFYNFTNGENTDKVYAIGLCRGDVEPENCRTCLNGSRANLTERCPNRKEAIGWYEDEKCMLRYSDRNIFGLMEIGPAFYANNDRNASDLDEFNEDVNTLLRNLMPIAASGDSRVKYAADGISSGSKVIYGLVQCTPDLEESECADCLSQSIERIPIDCCKDKIGGRVVRPSCCMRFETSFKFYGDPAFVPPAPPPSTTTTTGKSNATIIIAITVPVVVIVFAVLIFIYIRLTARKPRKKFETQKEEPDDDDGDDGIDASEPLQIRFSIIRDATNDFSDSNKLGQGGFGAVYRGTLPNGQEIAVKRLSANSRQGDAEFKNEVLLVAKLQHRNLVRLLGFSMEGREKLLVYEFVPNKSLDYFIFDETKRAQLDWDTRFKIIAGTARGILYLHQDSRLRIIHRDLKAGNILLDEEMNPKIADFGLARLFVVDQTHEDTQRVVGTYGYMAPEYALHGQFSEKSDVFSFGILILEIVSGQKISSIQHGEETGDLRHIAWRSWREGRRRDIVDPTLNNGSESEIMRCIHIGLLCVQDNAAARPTMASVVPMLNSHSFSLQVPMAPALYGNAMSGIIADMQLWEINSGTTRSRESTNRSDQDSLNEASITEPYPR
ncbi:putative receptor-like protein kinase At4g00960 [Vigna unguiculata]|uniref:Serine/threonine-protein kinase PBS1 n=1 Tax=Vigna unguiculata TaxID=3917 RepID=A0A4D6N686_VIGUN|nr:putative receptor-like protein kinase At4g00960 [Vigna unguiculata]QCE08412.1 serine/threonine-protein kinase PBS1 [Vigna unguiculata]